MKKHAPLLILLILFGIFIAFAFYKSPSSWFNHWSFKKEKGQQVEEITEEKEPGESELQEIAEEKILELQKQIDNLKNQQKTETETVGKTIGSPKSNTPVSTPTRAEEKLPAEDRTEEYREKLTGLIMSGITFMELSIDYIDEVLPNIDKRITSLNNMIRNGEFIMKTTSNPSVFRIQKNLVELYESDIEFADIVKKGLNNSRGLIQERLELLKTRDLVAISQFPSISSDEFDKIYEIHSESKDLALSSLSSVQDRVKSWIDFMLKREPLYEELGVKLDIHFYDL